MTKIHRYISLILGILFACQTVNATDSLDGDGYPVMYVRGFQTNNWSVLEDYRFTREGDNYTLHLEQLSGEFKISGDDWQYNLGCTAKTDISQSAKVTGISNGENFNAVNLTDLTISFTLLRHNDEAAPSEIKFSVAGTDITDRTSGTLPVLHINVYQYDSATGEFITDTNGNKLFENEVIDKDLAHKNYFKGEYWLDVNDCKWLMELGATSAGSEEAPLPLEIKARGNFTRRAFAKKPFKLKLGKKQNLLNMNINGGKSKHWAILAHADDNKGYLRNFTGFALGERIGLPWTPRQQPVEVIINGDYRGLYFLTESIRVGDGRVPVEELDDNVDDRALVSGGYIVELDNYDEDEDSQIQMEEKGKSDQFKDMLRITFDTPEVYSALQRRFINDQFTAINDLIGEDSDDMWRYLDIDDAARYYIVEEIISHTESYHGSTYLFRDRGEGEKWHFSPLWDCGNGFNGYTDAYLYDCDPYGNTWIPSLRMNATFNAKVKETWQWFMGTQGGYAGLTDDIDLYCARIAEAAKADARRWKGQPVPADGLEVTDNSDMESCKNDVKHHLSAKINWLAQQRDFGPIGGNHAEPERDLTPAQPLPSYAKEPDPAQTITVYFIDDSNEPWSDAYAYVYGPTEDGMENFEALGQWPGTLMQAATVEGKNGYALSFEPEHRPTSDAKIIINSGMANDQTIDFPLADGNIYYRSGKLTDADIVITDAADAEAEYFDVTGRRVANPVEGGIYIVRRGNTVSKETIR
ncbi:MAG: CotH kinase family protein [Muribaculaceae bacterium]|nr:CotH kinase family protein [Muribaculaceae bacterium]